MSLLRVILHLNKKIKVIRGLEVWTEIDSNTSRPDEMKCNNPFVSHFNLCIRFVSTVFV